MKHQPRPWVFEVSWGSPYSNPPAGQERVLLIERQTMITPHPVPPSIDAKMKEVGYGSGYATKVYIDPEFTEAERLKRQLSPEAKGRRRVQNLKRDAARLAPLFAEDIVQKQLATRPEYFAGKERP